MQSICAFIIISAYVCVFESVTNWTGGRNFRFFSLQRPLHKKKPQPPVVHWRPSPHALSLLARLQPVAQRSLHLRQVRYGDVQRLAGGRGGGEVVGVFPSIDDQKDSGDCGVLRRCGHSVKFHARLLNTAQQNSGCPVIKSLDCIKWLKSSTTCASCSLACILLSNKYSIHCHGHI